ncbi:Protein-associating with the carboxyl-terminal domain of ezrin [Pseudolycoriella hygida]|uniref:Protein-associating with the carboxyl-terminal domain of ezrin n=1 Tax=Pseudolycoriella hygida TaxID=35572 RepID=A0A9Q0N9L4_9DIPT|nr:Protein-associating with the carboxyl-terminal domain of ezrin [Pseudolycoriella hygida]
MDQSDLNKFVIDNKTIETTDYWSLHYAEVPKSDPPILVSVFRSEPVSGQFWLNQSPLERCIRNLKIYRHPSILKYISSWDDGCNKFLATEQCKPLAISINQQGNVQICLGLRNVLCGLIFLVEQASMRHLNVCLSSIYVQQDGTWKLSGLEQLWSAKEVTETLLEKSQPYRYKSSIDPNEIKNASSGLEQYAFGVLCEEVLKNMENTMPHSVELQQYCAVHLKHKNPEMRPRLSAVLLHPFFNHEFVLIHSFLTELPLKSQQEKQQFFTSLVDRLREFDEETVAIQLIDLLLSRLVLLDPTARQHVTPFILRPKSDELSPELFNGQTYKTHVTPKVMQIFAVRDTQIRLILLEYFVDYMNFFTSDELTDQLLPQLLVGIKDTNDILVAATLRCLADLVPILGSAVVVGRNRGKYFADGRPQGVSQMNSSAHWIEHRSITPVMNSVKYTSNSPLLDNADLSESYVSTTVNLIMPTRDGAEDIKSSSEALELEDDAWSDWEAEETVTTNAAPITPDTRHHIENSFIDVKELDIKTKRKNSEEIDFFKDMEPVIHRTNVLLITEEKLDDTKTDESNKLNNLENSRFDIKINECDELETGWGDDGNDWADDD